MDNIPVELVQAGGEAMIDILVSICNKIWKTGEWPMYHMDSISSYHTSKERQLAAVPELQNHISHPSIMLKIILTDSSHNQKRSLQKSKLVSERDGAPQNWIL